MVVKALKIEQREFLEILKLLEENYDKKMTDNITKIWYDEFKHFDAIIFKHCVVEAIKNEQFFPTINKVKEYEKKNIDYIGADGFRYVDGKRVL